MSELSGLYAIWQRELKVFFREKSRLIAIIVNPILWLFIFGGGLSTRFFIEDINYQNFLYPGTIVMAVLFSSIFYGAYIIWDRKLDFLKEVLVAPLNRSTIFFGKVLGGVTDALLQASVLLLLAPLFGVTLGFNIVLVYVFLFILVTGLVGMGLIVGSMMESPEGFGMITSFMNFPLLFLSGALYPLDNLPGWLHVLTRLNPVTYGVDAIRGLMLGIRTFDLIVDFAVLSVFAIAIVAIGTVAFRRMKV